MPYLNSTEVQGLSQGESFEIMVNSVDVKCFGEEELSILLKWEDVLPTIETALERYSCRQSNDIVQPVRMTVGVPARESQMYAMSCYSKNEDIFCTKLIVGCPKNAYNGMPTHSALITLFDGESGMLKALLSADKITAMRTAAASAIATKYLVNGTPKILTILGAGTQARSHFEAHRHLFNFTEVRVWNHRAESGKIFVEDIKTAFEDVVWCDTVREAVQNADVICVTAIYGGSPILEATWVKPGAHINAIGANQPSQQELDPNLMRQGVVYVDCKEMAKAESGDIIKSGVEIFAEIGEVISKRKEAFTESITIFKSSGMAIEDAAVANLAIDKFMQFRDKSMVFIPESGVQRLTGPRLVKKHPS